MEFLPFTRPAIDDETIQSVVEVLRSGWLASGPKVKQLEDNLSSYLEGRAVRSFTSATGALEVALQVCGVTAGDEVIVPAMTFAATANVVLRLGATPVFVDVDPVTRNMDLRAAERAVTTRTKAIMPVHFAGLPVDMDALYSLASRRSLRVVEDAAHAIGSRHGDTLIGSVGDLVVFSFHPNKNMTTTEGGAISLADSAEVKAIELHRFHGLTRDGFGNMDVTVAGGKHNLTDVAAAVGIGQLRRLEEFNSKRRTLAHYYLEKLQDHPMLTLPPAGDAGHSWHMFAPLVDFDQARMTRQEFIRTMHELGIGVGVHYPALHLFSLYRAMGYTEGQFPHAENIGARIVTLPLFPAMQTADVDRVCAALDTVLRRPS
jgi:dTDP-4-amino-4,6-dideoxygalactose transaminase